MISLPDHPTIAATERTGYHKKYTPLLCDTCKDAIQPGEYYGEFDGRKICVECIEDEWKELSTEEKVIYLGYDAKYFG